MTKTSHTQLHETALLCRIENERFGCACEALLAGLSVILRGPAEDVNPEEQRVTGSRVFFLFHQGPSPWDFPRLRCNVQVIAALPPLSVLAVYLFTTDPLLLSVCPPRRRCFHFLLLDSGGVTQDGELAWLLCNCTLMKRQQSEQNHTSRCY